MKMTCLNCTFCKVSWRDAILRCSKEQWNNGLRAIKLSKHELVNRCVMPRKKFQKAWRCKVREVE
jgi:hypothetical protein